LAGPQAGIILRGEPTIIAGLRKHPLLPVLCGSIKLPSPHLKQAFDRTCPPHNPLFTGALFAKRLSQPLAEVECARNWRVCKAMNGVTASVDPSAAYCRLADVATAGLEKA